MQARVTVPARDRVPEYDRTLFHALPVAVFVADARGQVLDANRAFLELVQIPLDAVIGATRPYPWRTDADDAPAEPGSVLQRRYRTPDGRDFPVEVATHCLGEPHLLTVAIVTDLSEKQRLEQQLVQSGKLAAIGELAAGVAHEINNPLLAILGLTEFLLQDAEPGSKSDERLRLIQETGLEIKEIVRALLDFARENADERHIVELEDVVRTTIDLVRRTNAHKGIEVVERYAAPGVHVSASANQLKQLLLNLVANGRQAMPNGGVIEIDVHRDAEHVLVVVTDEGPGIPVELAGRVFEPFFTTRRATGGSGLGLSVSLGIAEAHGGTLTLTSDAGAGGAAFTLRLPVVEGQ
jgi:PAS domain S-box-containing protein